MNVIIWRRPGTFAVAADPSRTEAARRIILEMERLLIAANAAFLRYAELRALVDSETNPLREWEANRELRQTVEAEIERKRGAIDRLDSAADARRREEIDVEVLKRKLEHGFLPRSYTSASLDMFARSFVLFLDLFSKHLRMLGRDCNESLRMLPIETKFDAELPNLGAVRDSISHSDERLKGQARVKNKRIVFSQEQLDSGAIQSGAIVVGSLYGNKYVWTLANGNQGYVEIEFSSILAAKAALTESYDIFSWIGPSAILPT